MDRHELEAVMIPRRAMLAAGPLALASCGRAEQPYFGRTDPPRTQRFVYVLGAEPGTLDPPKSDSPWGAPIIHALFDGLTNLDAKTGEPVAALATHYHMTSDGLRYTFWLRGHPEPGGIPISATVRARVPARWSDGGAITAHDFVYSWRRAVAPDTAAMYAALLFEPVVNVRSIASGKEIPEALGVQALDDFSLQVQLEARVPFFLRLLAMRQFFATPRQAIEKARLRGSESSWTDPAHVVTSGPFTLRERRRYDRILLVKNPDYYGAPEIMLEEILFHTVVDGATSANLYKAGEVSFSMPMAPQLLAGLRTKKDLHSHPDAGAFFPVMNTRKPPFDDVRVRYAINMATDKLAIARFLGEGYQPQAGVVPPMAGYVPPASVPVDINGTIFDIASYNPDAARVLLAKTGFGGGLSFEYLVPAMPDMRLIAEILQHQWKLNLGANMRIVIQDEPTWVQSVENLDYSGIAMWAEIGGLEDPSWFLDLFKSTTNMGGTGWSDARFDALLAGAKAVVDPSARMSKLAECESYLLQAMPCLPLCNYVFRYLIKPYVKGFASPFWGRVFNDAWIDTNWRPQ
ncbi:MAG: peptide ABC transporter substrate-binding protein [Bryobacteraceae bacterium]